MYDFKAARTDKNYMETGQNALRILFIQVLDCSLQRSRNKEYSPEKRTKKRLWAVITITPTIIPPLTPAPTHSHSPSWVTMRLEDKREYGFECEAMGDKEGNRRELNLERKPDYFNQFFLAHKFWVLPDNISGRWSNCCQVCRQASPGGAQIFKDKM